MGDRNRCEVMFLLCFGGDKGEGLQSERSVSAISEMGDGLGGEGVASAAYQKRMGVSLGFVYEGTYLLRGWYSYRGKEARNRTYVCLPANRTTAPAFALLTLAICFVASRGSYVRLT